jgi:hypothetical protein
VANFKLSDLSPREFLRVITPTRSKWLHVNPKALFRLVEPADFDLALALAVGLERKLALDGIKHHMWEGTGERCIREWERGNQRELERLRRAYEAGYETAPSDAVRYCRSIGMDPPGWAERAIDEEQARRVAGATSKKRGGRHSKAASRQADMVRDWLAVWWVDWLRRHNSDHSWKRAFAEAGDKLHMKPDAVRKAYARRRSPETEYWSETIAIAKRAAGLE